MPIMPTKDPSTRKEVPVILEEEDWDYVLSKLRKAVEPGCYEKSFCRLRDVIPRIENQVRTHTQRV